MARTLLFTALGIASLIQAVTHAQSYPVRPIRMIVPSAPGGLPDIQSRLMANELGKQLGQQVIVDNRPGASGIIGFELMARAPSDGYTVGYASFLAATNPSMFVKLPYDFAKDFRSVMHQTSVTNILAISPLLPVVSVQELIKHARANPDKLSYGISSFGASNHLAIELFKMMTGTRLVTVSYKAIQQAIAEAIAGHVRKETVKWAHVIKTAGIKAD